MTDETNRATAGATEAPEPEPGAHPVAATTDEAPADAQVADAGQEGTVAVEADAPSTASTDAPGGDAAAPDGANAAPDGASDGAPAAAATDSEGAERETPAADAAGEEAATSADQQDAGGNDAGQPSAVTARSDAPADEAPSAAAEPDEPMTMAQLMDNPDNEVKSLKHGDVIDGTVVRIDPDEILVDFGGKSEGVVSNRELMSRRGPRDGGDESRPELSVGDEVLVYVLQPESPEGHAVLSLRRAGLERKWRGMQERFDAGEIVEARVIDHNKGGLIVDLGVRGFVPISQIVDFPRRPRDEQPRDAAQEIAEKLQPFVGRTLRLKILEVNRKANRLILSEKVALYEERREKRDELFSSLQVGQRVTGVVRSIAPFGVFVDLGGIDGLVHKSELSWNKVNNPESAYQMGEEVEAEVIDINHERGRISLSIRRLQADPWQESVAKYTIGDVIDGTVTKLVNFGAFVRVEEGLEGLIHISELSNQRVAHPGDVVQEGQEVKLRIISLDSERHRLGLSLKQAEDRPAPAPREDKPRRERSSSNRRDRMDYRPEDATAEPEGGIDSTMAAAFASSGLLDQFRASQQGSAESMPDAAESTPDAAESTPDAAESAESGEAPSTDEGTDAAASSEAVVDGPAADATELADDLRGSEGSAPVAESAADETAAQPEPEAANADAAPDANADAASDADAGADSAPDAAAADADGEDRPPKSEPVADDADAAGETDGAKGKGKARS